MTPDPRRSLATANATASATGVLSRRDLLRAAALGGVAAFLGACGPGPAPSPAPSAASPRPSTVPPSASSTRAPSPSAIVPSPAPSASTGPSGNGPDLRARIAALLVVGFRGSRLEQTAWLRTALAETGLGGVILFDRDQLTGARRNVVSPAQVRTLTADLRAAASGRPILIGTDQEGGIVTRLGPATGFPAVASEAEIGRGSTTRARSWARTIATTLADAGIDLNFAPVVDLDVNPRSAAIGALDRSFSADPDVVVRMATIEIEAHRARHVLTTLKHFPGIGSATTNTDFGVADVTRTWTPHELEPFRQLIASGAADLVMAGHVVNGKLDPDRPASLSQPTVEGVLRGQLGWDGVVVTDDLQAAAITRRYGRDEAVVMALEAGCDLLLFANQQVYEPGIVRRAIDAVEAAVAAGRLPRSRIDEAYGRVTSLVPR